MEIGGEQPKENKWERFKKEWSAEIARTVEELRPQGVTVHADKVADSLFLRIAKDEHFEMSKGAITSETWSQQKNLEK